ncbi:MAG: DUF2237 domain-containing protein [Alcanivoracaceae bacterium]|nr:DUF2237 domain-containing protein [Alcanivoracaceae bacterium]
MKIDESINVLGEVLQTCGENPVTGFFRDGKCNTCKEDEGSHTVCIQVTQEFLQYSRFAGNDLSTSIPEFGFVGLKPGDNWCLCALRWLEAHQNDRAPKIYIARTHIRALEVIPLELFKKFAVDLN